MHFDGKSDPPSFFDLDIEQQAHLLERIIAFVAGGVPFQHYLTVTQRQPGEVPKEV